jgi:hypothetical protein
MHRSSLLSKLCVALVFLVPVVATGQEKEPATFVYATYFECDVSQQERVDDIVKSSYAPAYDAAVEAGTISSWGWMAHQTGGKWRRVLYYSAKGLDALVDAPESINATIDETNPSAHLFFGEICNSHDDYIWEVGTGSKGMGVIATDRGKVGMSVYFDCDMGEEDRADEIIEKNLAPIYNKHVTKGGLTSWGWLKHYVGGKYRRVATTTSTDIKTLLATRNAIFAEVNEKAKAAGDEFGEICGSHQDYIWNIVHEVP